MKISALIPARGGSKGIIKKNIIDFAGKPLIAWTIDFALQSKLFSEVIVSTDSNEIAEISKQYGARVQIRPTELSSDTATALQVIEHAFANYIDVDNITYLQPTSPFRKQEHLREAISLLPKHDSVVSVMKVPHSMTPESIMKFDAASLSFVASPEQRIFSRQAKPEYVCRNGPSLLLTKRKTIIGKESLYGENIGGVIMDTLHSIDIDTPEDLQIARALCNVFLDSKTKE